MSAVKRRRTESEEVMDVDLIEQAAADAPASTTSQSDSPWSGDRLPPEVVAAAAGDLKQLQKLLAGGGRIDAVGASGITPVYAASKAGHVEIVAFLVGKRAAVDVRVGVKYPTALCAAADAGHLDVVKILLAAGAQSDACSIDGVCPLVAAASRGHAEIVQTLLEGGEKAESAASRRQLALFAAMNDGPNTGSTAIVCSALLDAGVSVNEADSDGDTALHCAALAGKVECAQLLLAANADAAARHDDGWTPLHSAASQGHTPVAQLLLKAAASPKKMFSGESCDKAPVLAPLSVAIENGNVETATALIAAEEAGLLHASGALSLMCAVRQGDLTMARLVLECGNDVDATTPELPGGATALAIGIEGLPRAHPPTAALVKFLIEAGADVSIEYNLLPPNEGVKTTPLHRVAAVFPDAELTRLLLDAGAGVNALNSSGATPLCVAAARPDSSPEVVAMVRTLVAAGANVCYTQVADEKGESPLFMAVNHAPTPDIVEMVEVMAAADPRAVGLAATDGTTPLIMACQNAKDSLPATVVEALLKCQADVSQPSTVTGSTAMHITAYMGNPSVLEVLMAAGAPVDQPNHEGITPLYWATRNGHPRAVKVLLEAGADATQTFSLGHPWSTSLLQEPVCKDDTEVLALLIAANTDPNTTSGRILEPPLFRAAAEGSERAAQVLIAAGADIEKTTTGPNPETPLAVAVDCGYENLAGMLVAAGANFKTLDFPDYLSMMFQAYRRYCVRDGAMFLRTHGKDRLLPETERLQLDAMSTIRQTKTDPAESILTQRQSLNSSAFCDKLSQTLKVATQLDRLDLVEIMLANGAPVDQPDTDGITPLVEACRRGHLGIARCLVAAGATVNPDDSTATASGGSTPLLAACKRGHTEVARLLLDHGASVRPPPPSNSPIIGFTPLHAAARGGDVATVALLLTADASPTAAFLPSGTTPIHAAAEHGHAEVVAMLLKAGGEVDACRADGATALSLAARVLVHPFAAMDCAATSPAVFVPDHTTVNTLSSAQVLLEAGADVGSVTSDDSSTPLHFAALRGHLAMAEILVKAGANVNARRTDLESTTALSLAARYGHTAVVSLLLEHGATVDDSLALFHAAQAGQTDVYQLLVQHGADPSITRASDGESPQSIAARSVAANTANASPQEEGENTSALFQAVAEGDVNSVHRLLEDGANANAVSSDGVTVLSAAAEVRDTAIMFALLGSGADVNLCSEHGGHTALHHAAHSGCGANVPLLLAANANCDSAAGAQGETPLMMASKSGAVDVTELLLKRGVSINAIKSQGGTALMQASTIGICGSHFNKRFAVRVLATHGADVDAADSDGKTALHVAIEECNVGTVDELLQAQANVDHVSARGDFPLLLASRYGVPDILRLVLAADADVNRQGPRGETSLYAAVAEAIGPDKDRGVAGRFDSRKYVKSVQLLLCHGADPNIPAWHSSSQSRTALQLACEHNRNDLVSLLLDVGADPAARVHPTEQTALHLAIATGGVDVVTSLLNATADVNARGADNVTLLVAAAAGNEEPDVFNALVAAGADVNARSPRLTPLTPLMLAVRRGWRDSVDQLLAQGADVNAKTRHNETALAMAVDSEDCECVEALVRAGAHVRTAHASTLITPLGSAVKTQQHRLADFLREVGAGPEKAPPSILCDGVMCPCGGRAVEGPRWHHDATGRNFCTAAYKALALAEAEGCTSAPLATETASLFVFLRGVAKSVA